MGDLPEGGKSQLPTRKYAVIIDEAHSSQSGETATELKGVLGGAELRRKAQEMAEEEGKVELERLFRSMAKRGHQPNMSFFAFTATPKHKTLAIFGRNGEPFHRYTMRQAIEEGFIEDVLKSYVTYKTYYKLIKKAAKALARFMRLHPHNIDQKTEVMGEQVDPDKFYEVKAELDASGIYLQPEVTEFARVFFAPKRRQSPGDHKAMNAILDQAVTRFAQLQSTEEEEAELWRGKLQAFRNLYSFLSQVIPYQDSDLEKLFTYLRHLALKLPKRKSGPGYQFNEEVELDYYRLQKISEGSISLDAGYVKPLDGPREVDSGMVREEHVSLSRLIDIINQRFGGELNEADQLFFDQIAEAASQNEALQKAAEVNSLDKFQLVFRQVLESLFIERMELNEELFTDYMGKPEMQELVSKWLGSQVYDRLSPGSSRPFGDPDPRG